MTPEHEARICRGLGIYDGKTSGRAKADVHYQGRAMLVVAEQPGMTWLCDIPALERGVERGAWQPTILSELGRIQDDTELLAVAQRLCELKPQVRDAIRMIRSHRLGTKPAEPQQLAREVARVVDDYRARHPDLRMTDVSAVLRAMADTCDEIALRGEGEG